MSLTTAVVLIAILDLAVIAAVAAIMSVPFVLDRKRASATVHVLEAQAPLDLAA